MAAIETLEVDEDIVRDDRKLEEWVSEKCKVDVKVDVMETQVVHGTFVKSDAESEIPAILVRKDGGEGLVFGPLKRIYTGHDQGRGYVLVLFRPGHKALFLGQPSVRYFRRRHADQVFSVSVQDYPDDKERLKKDFKYKTGYEDCVIDEWHIAEEASMTPKHDYTMAIVVRFDRTDCAVRIFDQGGKMVVNYTPDLGVGRVQMLFLKKNWDAIIIGQLPVKYIRKS